MPSFGEKLKLEREKRKITLEQISASTKIGTRMLQALEEDKFNQLPGGIFNKGFVRAYSRCVGLDEDQTVADYLEASGDAHPASAELEFREDGSQKDGSQEQDRARKHEENLSRLEASAGAPPRQLPWGAFAAVLLLVALALSLWSRRQREHPRPSVPPNPTTSAAQLPAEPSAGAASPPSASPTPATPAPASPKASSPTTASPTAASAPSLAPKTSQDLATAAPTAIPGEFTVVIHAREDSWISITADGKTGSSELLAAGSERTARGRKEIIVKAGNAGAIGFLFNGKKLDIGGEFGEVKTVTFGPDGLLPNASAPPSTP